MIPDPPWPPARPAPLPAPPTCRVCGEAADEFGLCRCCIDQRDAFAGAALTGLLANPDEVPLPTLEEIRADIAANSYAYADAMLAARRLGPAESFDVEAAKRLVDAVVSAWADAGLCLLCDGAAVANSARRRDEPRPHHASCPVLPFLPKEAAR